MTGVAATGAAGAAEIAVVAASMVALVPLAIVTAFVYWVPVSISMLIG